MVQSSVFAFVLYREITMDHRFSEGFRAKRSFSFANQNADRKNYILRSPMRSRKHIRRNELDILDWDGIEIRDSVLPGNSSLLCERIMDFSRYSFSKDRIVFP